jgi:hypothetical protein
MATTFDFFAVGCDRHVPPHGPKSRHNELRVDVGFYPLGNARRFTEGFLSAELTA